MENPNSLFDQNFAMLSPNERLTLQSYFKSEKLQKNEFFTRADQVCNRFSIIKSGILRIYALHDGKEITQWIAGENHIITEVMGFFFDRPNRFHIQAFTEVELLTLHKEDYHKVCMDFPQWNSFEKELIASCIATMEQRIFSHLSLSAEERYQLYYEKNKNLFNQVPLQYIASLLGMSPETLSRIRNKVQ